mgnify:CR=1 FL=1
MYSQNEVLRKKGQRLEALADVGDVSGGSEEDGMDCSGCGKEMQEGFLQGSTNNLFFNRERQKSAVCTGDGVNMAQGRLRPSDFNGFICRECGIVVFDYKNVPK